MKGKSLELCVGKNLEGDGRGICREWKGVLQFAIGIHIFSVVFFTILHVCLFYFHVHLLNLQICVFFF